MFFQNIRVFFFTISIVLTGHIATSQAGSNDVNFNPDTGILSIPVVNVAGKPMYQEAQLQMQDNSWVLVSVQEYTSDYPYSGNYTTESSYSEYESIFINDVIRLDDDRSFLVVGAPGILSRIYEGQVTVYEATSDMPDPSEGERSNYFMVNEGADYFYVEEFNY